MLKENFTASGKLFYHYLKRDYKKIVFWVLGLGLFSGGFIPAFKEIGTADGLMAMFETMKNPAMIAIVGPTPVKEASAYTIGALYSHEMLLFCGLFAFIISLLHVVSHTRKEEDLGLTELVRSFKVGRLANSCAVLLETLLIQILYGLVVFGTMYGTKVSSVTLSGIAIFSLSLVFAGLLGGVLGLLFAQIMPNASGATGIGLTVLGLLYMVRASTDASNLLLSKLNPLGWIYLTFPFTENNVWPLLIGGIFLLILCGVAFSLEKIRDLGAGFIPERQGRAHAKKSLLSVLGLLWKQNKGMTISWLVGFVAMGAAYGAIYGDMQSFLESNELMKQMFTQTGESLEATFTATIMMVLVSLVFILPIAMINKTFQGENRGYFTQLYASKMTFRKLYLVTLSLAFFVGVVGLFLTGLSLGFTGEASQNFAGSLSLGDFLKAAFNFLPALVFFMGLNGFLLGFAPRLGKLSYLYLGYGFFMSYFAGILNLPDWLQKTALQNWFAAVPAEKMDLLPWVLILLLGLALSCGGLLGYEKRDRIENV